MHQRELDSSKYCEYKINLNESLADDINILDYVIVYYIHSQILFDY